ncbi:conserved hypothetical protein [Verrucomicrobia bacterium]|nr:conserved hypothetical protein [Verrucomicrobiota bacterium]
MISKFKIESFKSIESAELELGRVNVFIGANGSGKSNLLEALGLLAAAAFGRVDTESLVRRGCRPAGYYRPLFRESPSEGETAASAMGAHVTYGVGLQSPPPDRPTEWEFRHELWTLGEQVIVDRGAANGVARGDVQAGLAALKLAELPVEGEASIFLKTLAGYSIYTPDTAVLRGWMQDPQLRVPVGLSGGRLADAVAELLKDQRTSETLKAHFRAGVEWFEDFGIVTFNAGAGQHRQVAFVDRFFRKDGGHVYLLGPNEVNEGALYLQFLAVLCLHPSAPELFALDNADHGLNPVLAKNVMSSMCHWLLEGRQKRQVLITTQNPLALDGLPLADDRVRLFTVDRDNRGTTRVRRFVITGQHRDMAAKGWTLSRLWVNGLIGGVPNV